MTVLEHSNASSPTIRPSRSSLVTYGAVVLALLFEFGSRALRTQFPALTVPAALISLVAILVLLSPALYLILKLDGARPLKYSLVFAVACISVTQILNITSRLPLFDGWPMIGSHSEWYDTTRWAFMVLGLVLMLASLYFALLEAVHARAYLLEDQKALLHEISVRQRAEAALVEQEKLYSQAISQAGAIPYRLNWKSKTVTFFQDEICAVTGYSLDELTFDFMLALPRDVRFFGELAGLDQAEFFDQLKKGEIRNWRCEYRITTKDGRERWISDSSVETIGNNGSTVESVGLLQDITDRKREEEAVSRNERYFRALIENASDLITVLNSEGTIQYVSPSVERVLGYSPEELIGQCVYDNIHPEDLDGAANAITVALRSVQATSSTNIRFRHQNGSWRILESIGRSLLDDPAVSGAVINSRDITERVTLEQQLVQSQKMEGIGRLAGGVAHDFNNLLTCILGYGDLALVNAPEDSRLHAQLELLLEAGRRASDLTRQLLAFARKHPAEPRPTDLNALTMNLEKMLRRLIGEDIELATFPAKSPAVVTIDPGNFEQVIINLAVNARDAMPGGGKLTIEIDFARLDKAYTKLHSGVTPGDFVVMAVTDSGMGMTEEVQEHLFEPFFTTKEENKGTGLGLATCYGIVKQAGGHIWVYSEPGQGTTIRIYLPRVFGAASTDKAPEFSARFQGGTETILLVEDDPLVRDITIEALTTLGYSVLEAQDGPKALEIARVHPHEIHLLLTDVIMPRMSGMQIAEEIVRVRPETRVLFMSGYAEDAILHQGILEQGISFLPKPFTPSVLAGKLRTVLGDS